MWKIKWGNSIVQSNYNDGNNKQSWCSSVVKILIFRVVLKHYWNYLAIYYTVVCCNF